MNILRLAIQELVGMFIDDGSLALYAVILITLVTAGVKLLAVPPLLGGIVLLLGCLAILVHSTHRATQKRKDASV